MNNKKVVHGQARQIIFNVYKFMKQEKDAGKLIIPINCLQERVAGASGVSLNTVKRIVKEAETKPEGTEFKSPRQTINKPSPKSTITINEEQIIRDVIYNLNSQESGPTMNDIYEAVKNQGVNLTGSIYSFRKIIRKLGFQWKKIGQNKKILIETEIDVKPKHTEFLADIKKEDSYLPE